MATTLAITPEKMAAYRATALSRRQIEESALAQRKARALGVARQAAALLKAQFGATEVLLFGSLAHEQWFTTSSDIDLAAWHINPANYFRAVAYLQDISPEFSIDLVSLEDCNATLRATILVEGKTL